MKRLLIFLLACGLALSAQQPQTHTAPTFKANAKWVNGVAPGYAPTAGASLTLNLSAGTAFCGGSVITYAGGTLTMTGSTTNNVYLDTASSCAPAVKTSAFTSADIPIAVVTTTSSITAISDVRTMMSFSSAGMVYLACETGLGDGLNAMAAGTYLQTFCYNTSGITWTITGIRCFTDNSGSSTLNATNGSATALLTGAVTCSSSFAAGTQSATVTIASGDYIKFTFVADGTSKQTTWVVAFTQ